MKTLTKRAKMRQVQREIKRHIKFDLEPMLMDRARDMVTIASESWLDKEDDTILRKIINRK